MIRIRFFGSRVLNQNGFRAARYSHSFEIHARCYLSTPCSFISFSVWFLSTPSNAFFLSRFVLRRVGCPTLLLFFCCHQDAECSLWRVAVFHEGCLEGFAFDLSQRHQPKVPHQFPHRSQTRGRSELVQIWCSHLFREENCCFRESFVEMSVLESFVQNMFSTASVFFFSDSVSRILL